MVSGEGDEKSKIRTSHQSSNTITYHLTGEEQENGRGAIWSDVVEQTLDGEDFSAKGRVCGRGGHNDDHCILLFVEGSRVEIAKDTA